MRYTSFTISKPKKNHCGDYRIEAEHDRGDGWTGSGNFLDLYRVSGMLVAMRFMKPVAVYRDLEHCCDSLEKQYGVRPVIK